MRRFLMVTFGAAFALQAQAYAETCANPYEKAFPYSQQVLDDNGQINLHQRTLLRYDCKTFTLESSGGIDAKFYGLEAQLIDATVAASSSRTNAQLSTSVMVLGYEIVHEDEQLTTLYSKTFKPEHDLDLAQDASVQVGPLLVPIRYGIQGTSALRIDAAMRNFGAEVQATPTAKANAYLLAGVDVTLIKGSARGELLLVDAQMNNLGVHFSPQTQAPTIDVNALGSIQLQALDGAVTARVEIPEGGQTKTYDQELFHWTGYGRNEKIYDHSERIAELPR